MKPTTLFFSLLSAIGVSTVSALPSFAQTTPVPITGGNLSASADLNTGILSYDSASLLTSFGTITLTAGSGALTIPAINYDSSTPFNPPTRLPAVGDDVNYSGLTNGIISGQSFVNAPTNGTGTVTSFSLSLTTATATASVTSGTIALPSSLVSSLSSTTGGTTGITNNSPISSIIPLNDVDASNLFNSQPVLESGKNFLPPSSLAGSRIHPDLSSR